MTNHSATIVQKLWNYCNVLRDDGVSYGDYVEQLTYLLFLKTDDEQVCHHGKPSAIPAGLNWQSLANLPSCLLLGVTQAGPPPRPMLSTASRENRDGIRA